MNKSAQAVDALTRPWTDVLSPKESGTGQYQPVDYPPLLDMLDEAVRSSLGKTESGRSPDAERSIMNLTAFSLREHIDGTTRAWLREFSKQRSPEGLKDALISLAGILEALHASNQIKDVRYEHVIAQFPRWKAQIWELFDPPIVKDLKGECPNCHEVFYFDLEGGKRSALIAFYWRGIRPEAKCNRCGEHWVGERDLLELGYHLGASVDEAALKEMGVL